MHPCYRCWGSRYLRHLIPNCIRYSGWPGIVVRSQPDRSPYRWCCPWVSGIAAAAGKGDSGLSGFGIVTLASLLPINCAPSKHAPRMKNERHSGCCLLFLLPLGVVFAYQCNGLVGGIDAVRDRHVLGIGEFESRAQHVAMCPLD